MSLTRARELAVLSIVIAHPVHGYQIASALEEGPQRLLGLKRAAVYAILSRFLERGWITEKEEPGGAYPDRRVCHATDDGRKAARDLLDDAGGLSQTPLMALTMLHDSGTDVSEAARAQIEARKSVLKDLLGTDGPHARTMSRELACATVAAEIAVLERLLKA